MKEGEAGETVGSVVQQRTGIRAIGGELHQTNGAAGACLHPEGDHAGTTVVTGVEAGVGAEGLTLLEHAIEPGETTGLQALRIQRMGLGRFPESEQLVAEAHHVGVGNVLQPKVKGIGQAATGLLAAEHAAIEHLAGLLLRQPALGAHETVAQADAAVLEPHRCDHAVAIEGVMHTMAIPLQPPWTIAVQGAVQLRWHGAARSGHGHIGKLLIHVRKGARPVAAVVVAGGGDGHGQRVNV